MTSMIHNFAGKRVTVMGLGRFGGGVGAARWLARQGAEVTVSDQAPAEQLQQSLERLRGLDVTLHLGGHRDGDFDADLLVVNPAVPPRAPGLESARERGTAITTEINLFVERCAARVVGITGSVGKSTVTAMIGHVLSAVHERGAVHVGGNLGASLLEGLETIAENDLVVLELSSFQLERTPLVGWSPHVALITNLSPNHLDWHETYDAYARAKANIYRFQDRDRDYLIVGSHAELLAKLDELDTAEPPRDVWQYGLEGPHPLAFVREQAPGREGLERVYWSSLALPQPGAHNRENAAAALTVAHVLGFPDEAAVAALRDFPGLPHRLQLVAERDGVRYFDDSKATTPEATRTALAAFDGPVILILGGYDKGSDFGPLAEEVARRCKFVACLGQTGPTLHELITGAGGRAELFEDLEQVVRGCGGVAEPGDVVLLSPACASWGMFVDYRERGQAFAALVSQR